MAYALTAALAIAAPTLRAIADDGSEGAGENRSDAPTWHSVTLSIVNHGNNAPLHCQVLLAHWYALGFGPVAAGEDLAVALLVRPQTGEVAIPNDVGDNMRIERMACGSVGTPRDTWVEPSLDTLRTSTTDLSLSCQEGSNAGQLTCQFTPP